MEMDIDNLHGQVIGGEAMEVEGWRNQLHQDSRQRIVNKMMETLKKHLPFPGQEGLQELKKIAVRFEEKIYTAATSQSDYLRKISLKMLTMEAKSQNPMANSLQSNAAINSTEPQDSASLDSSSQTGSANGGDWQEEIYQKIKSMHEMYYPELNEMYQRMADKLRQHDAHPQQPKNEQLEKLRFLKLMMERLMMFLQTNKNDIQPNHKDKIGWVEKKIVNILNSNRPRKAVSSMLQGQLTQPHMHPIQQSQQQQPQMRAAEDSSSQIGSATDEDWQERTYQKIKAMHEMYYPELNEMYQRMSAKLLQLDAFPQQRRSESHEKLRFLKPVLERLIMFLRTNKNDIQPNHEDKIGGVEKQIVNILNSNRPRKAVSSMQQGQLTQPHMHPMQQFQQQQPQMPAAEDSSSRIGSATDEDWQERTYQKIKAMHEMYYPELNEMYQRMSAKLLQLDAFPQQRRSESHEKLKFLKPVLERLIMFLRTNKNDIQPNHEDKIGGVEKQIVNILNSNRPRKAVSSMQQGQLTQPHMHPMQQFQQQQPQMPAAEDSSSQIGSATDEDWQERTYQKIKAMHEMYYPELNEMYQRMSAKLLQLDAFPQQRRSESHEKLKFLKPVLERLIMFLRTNKNDIQPNHEDKIGGVEKQIVNILNSNRPRKAVSSMQQGQLTQPHMHPMQQFQQQQPQMPAAEDSSSRIGSATDEDWQERTYQKIKAMHEMHYPELNALYQQMAAKLQQLDAFPQQLRNESLENLRFLMLMMERLLKFLQTNKNDIHPNDEAKIAGVGKAD